ncbi:MAG: isoprenylcysteine carboxylmethyltransferase family protein [Gemmatimonadaceae bacterium]|jgi:protein-S-isoprenylcysteine O-methyltransferase Ste14|nr:isoprenylcysteine carboxylmethyltransferase family protein [Gemmatimonadaceae bacterium]
MSDARPITEFNLAQKLRLPLGFAFAALYLWLAPRYATPLGVAIGIGIAVLGLLVRAWAVGHIVKNDTLTTSGPYAHVRNPLYFGSFLLACGFAIAAHWSLLGLVGAFWLAVYQPTWERERQFLKQRYGEAYRLYEQNVPAFFPRLTPWAGPGGPSADAQGFSMAKYLRHKEWNAALGFAAVMAWLLWRMPGAQ